MTAPTCGTCRWFRPVEHPSGLGTFHGKCHIRSTPYGEFPSRLPDDFCGEHTPKGEG